MRVWSTPPYNFDHLGNSLVSLFITSTLNGYTEIMSHAMAAPEEPGLQPQPMSNWSAFFFFAVFVLVVAYTLLNLYIGVVFYQFSRIRMQSQTGSAFLTDDQTEWVELSRLVFRLKPPEKSPVPVNRLRRCDAWLLQKHNNSCMCEPLYMPTPRNDSCRCRRSHAALACCVRQTALLLGAVKAL